ncbi:MAG: HAD family phosphatase [Anaerolineae bacterium]|nr:HAD family phosphatase [Anaerolineae bacterium]
MMTIQALIFDWGGVIQRTLDPRPRLALDEELGLPHGTVERAVFSSPVWELACLGKCDADTAWREIVASLRYPDVVTFIERFFAGDRLDARLLTLIRDLRAQGMPVGLLSNAPPERQADSSLAGRWGQAGVFDVQLFSYQLGVLKPHPDAYRAILDALGAEPEHTLFVDDAQANIQGAWREGMNAIQFRGTPALMRAFKRFGIAARDG